MKVEYISKLITDKTDKKVIKNYLEKEFSVDNKYCKSSYYAAIWHARDLTGRNQGNGILINNKKCGNWAGACMYLILIDHIGEKFAIQKIKLPNYNTPFKWALENFTNLDKLNINILYQLRNSFLHQFNLYNFPKRDNYFPRHFSVDRSNILIKMPEQEFNGSLKELSEKNVTKISLKELGNLVEEIHKELLVNLDSEKLYINIPKGIDLGAFLMANTLCYEKK